MKKTDDAARNLKGDAKKEAKVEEAVRAGIAAGELRPGERLMPLGRMAAKLKVSQSAVYRAMQRLVEDDMVECRGARGYYVREAAAAGLAAGEVAASTAAPGRVYLFCNHHSDLTWKYPYAKYAAIREKQLDAWVAFHARHPQFTAFAEQAEVLRVYVEGRPERLEALRAMHAAGALTLSCTHSIHDLNMCCGEQLARNLQDGRAWCRDNFGVEVDLACFNDAFGMVSQLPQVLAQSGCAYLYPGRRPAFPRAVPGNAPFLWRGLDGSTVAVVPATVRVDSLAFNCNAPFVRTEVERLDECLAQLRDCPEGGDVLAIYETEVQPLREEVFAAVERANRVPGRHRIRFGSLANYCHALDVAALPEVVGEFNPVFTGCYTTRIGVKQLLRSAENALFAAELLAAGRGQARDFAPAWRALRLGSFHDAACGCHTDPANRDVVAYLTTALQAAGETLKAEGAGVAVLNPGGAGPALVEFPDDGGPLPEGLPAQKEGGKVYCVATLPAHGVATFPGRKRAVKEGAPCGARFATDRFAVECDGPYPRVRDLRTGTDVFPSDGFGEILFRFETGSMWSEVLMSGYLGRECQREKVVAITEGEAFYQIVTAGEVEFREADDGSAAPHWDGFESLRFTRTWRFYKGLDYFTLRVGLDWKGCNTKISIRFPVRLDVHAAECLYDVPFGAQHRAPYYEVPRQWRDTLRELNPEDYQHAAGDWPALHWVDYCDHRQGLAMANSGTPGHQLVGGAIIVSLLRSGTMVADGGMRPMPGALDNGHHEYEFAFRPHAAGDWRAVATIGETLNRRPVALGRAVGGETAATSFFGVSRPNVIVSSVRPVADGVIVRLYENAGEETEVEFSGALAQGAMFASDLREREWEPVPGRKLHFSPFAIRTLKFVPAPR
ncbi:MAG: GntR family transcriptional regulator [Planctomycetes bacterium]|nr:GntR family transcriptional regulator [Planctomycetota bacterium]